MRRAIVRAVLPFAVVLLAATAGYMLFWDWSFVDALFMSVITVATVGYNVVRPLEPAGQVFTILVILCGALAGGYALARIVEILIAEQLVSAWEGRRMKRRIGLLHGHTVLAGMGRVGMAVARTLEEHGTDFVVIDSSPDRVVAAVEQGWLAVSGDATEEEVLLQAGVDRAAALITALDTDAENLFVTVSAKALNPSLFIVARSSHESAEAKMLKAGADRVLTPNVIGGRRMASLALHPTVSDYLDLVSHGSQTEFRLQEVVLGPDSSFKDRTISEARIRETTGVYILAVRHNDGTIDPNPGADTVLHAGDRLVVLGAQQQVDALAERA